MDEEAGHLINTNAAALSGFLVFNDIEFLLDYRLWTLYLKTSVASEDWLKEK